MPTSSPSTTAAPEAAHLVAQATVDRHAFALLYREYVSEVYRYCYRRLGSREEAEDATSQIFTQALAGLARLGERPFRAWLFTIARNVVIDAYRVRWRTRPLPDEESLAMREIADPDPSPEQELLRAERGTAIRTLLGHLPDESRQLLELRLAGLTDVEIAHVLGRSHGAVRVAQSRTVARLRALQMSLQIVENADV